MGCSLSSLKTPKTQVSTASTTQTEQTEPVTGEALHRFATVNCVFVNRIKVELGETSMHGKTAITRIVTGVSDDSLQLASISLLMTNTVETYVSAGTQINITYY